MLMYIGGMQMTPRPRYAPSRTLEPPGTMRTPDWTCTCFNGSVSLSRNGQRSWLAVRYDSTVVPYLKPRRMPRLTQAFTRQPDGDAGLGSAARTSPRDSAWRSVV